MNKKSTGKKSTALKKIPKNKKQKKSIQKLTDVNSLIATAVKSKASMEAIKELVKMKYENEDREAKKLFHLKFCQMQSEFPVIVKRKEVRNYQKELLYKYAPLEDIIKQILPVMKLHGFSYHWSEEFIKDNQKRIICHINGHGHSENAYTDLPIMSGSKLINQAQQSGSTSTYGKRYSLIGILGIMADEDDDGRGSENKPAEPIKNVTPEKEEPKKPEVIPPDKPRLPDNIKSTDICKLGAHKDIPLKYDKVPLGHLLAFQKQAANPEALNTVIHETIDKRITDYKTKLGYKDTDLKAMIKLDIKKDVEYIDLNQSQKLIIFRNIKNVSDKLEKKE